MRKRTRSAAAPRGLARMVWLAVAGFALVAGGEETLLAQRGRPHGIPAGATDREEPTVREEDYRLIVAPPRLAPLELGSDERFYDLPLSDAPRDDIYYPHFQNWYAHYTQARELRVGFDNLVQYDRWFLSIPGAGAQIVPWMQDAYTEAMSPNVRGEYDTLIRQRTQATQSAAPQVAAPPIPPGDLPAAERRKLAALRVTNIGGKHILFLAPGRIASEGDVFATTNSDVTFFWKIEGVAETGGIFSMVESVTNRVELETKRLTRTHLRWMGVSAAVIALAAAFALYRALRRR